MATTSVYESARMTHEEIEQYEDALVDTLNNPPKASSHRLMLQWQLAASALLDQMVSRFATLDTMYADATQERVQEWEALGRQDEDPFSEFDARLAELQSFYRRYPERAITLQTTATPSVLGTHDVSLFDLSAIEREFSGEEMGGRFLDLYVHYESYINLRGAPRLSYLEYIARLDTAAASVPPTTKRTETYHAYSQALVQYLSAFLHKTRPLEDMDTVEARALASFDSDWEHGVVPGWEAREAVLYGEHRAPGEGIWCGACQRSYAKQTVYDAHLTSARHQKAAARVQAAPESAPDREAAARASELEHAKKVMRAKLVARDEVLIQALAHELATVREETRTNVERKAALTEREREEEAEALEAELDEAVATGGLGYEDAPERGTPGGGDKMYNPLKLPMGWDGKPIPFWMYKLHGLRVEYKCEICSDHVYKGRKVFEKHFGESRHAFGMRALGLPNTAPFRGVTRIQEAFALAEKLKQQSRANYVDEDDTVEVEDEHGNYRFVMKPTFDGTRYLSNPDLPLPWHDIVQVLVNANSDVTVAGCGVSGAEPAAACPICLAPPVAPRMTRCGHVYCYPCILHYLIVSENGSMQQRSAPRRQSKRCPICWDDVTRSDLKAVHWIDARAAAAEHTNAFLAQRAAETGGLALLDHASELHEHAGLMTLRLVARPQDQTLALPRNAAHWPPLNSRVPTCAESDAVIFARFMLATPEFLCASLRADIAQIDAEAISLQQWKADELSLEFLRVARAELVQTLDATSSVHSSTADVHLAAEADTSPAAYFYFQAASGQTVFLHPIDIKVLLAHFGTYADFPDTLLVVVQNMEEGTMDEQLRRRCKYLAQPMSSDVTFIEVDWPRTAELLAQVQGVVPWQAWEDTLLQRQRRHQDKAVREERARQRAEKCARRAEASAQSEPEMPLIQTDFPLSFRESAMVGAEMFFPTHPGADPTPFPSMTPATDTAPFSAPDQPRTVWGTPAAAGAAAATSPPSREMDDAWNALEASASSEQARPQRQRQKRGKPKLILTGGGRGSL